MYICSRRTPVIAYRRLYPWAFNSVNLSILSLILMFWTRPLGVAAVCTSTDTWLLHFLWKVACYIIVGAKMSGPSGLGPFWTRSFRLGDLLSVMQHYSDIHMKQFSVLHSDLHLDIVVYQSLNAVCAAQYEFWLGCSLGHFLHDFGFM